MGTFMSEKKTEKIFIKPHKLGWRERIFFLLSGIIVSIPITLFLEALDQSFYSFLPMFITQFIAIVIFAPFIEEFSKAYPLFYRYSLSERSLYILALLVGLGFGITEFCIYVFVYGVPFYLRIPGVLFHAASTSIIAFGIIRGKPFLFYLLAVSLHMGANFFAIIDQLIPSMVVTFFTVFLSWLFYKRTTENYLEPE